MATSATRPLAITFMLSSAPSGFRVDANMTSVESARTHDLRDMLMTAAKLGAPRAMRAVGHANGANPISVVVPCHRLIGANGSLVKYGGGLERKRWLLKHEGVEV